MSFCIGVHFHHPFYVFDYLFFRVVEMLIKLLVRDEVKGGVMNRKRFEEEFTGEELAMPKKNRRPEDYEAMFAGNTDDTFRLGLTLTKKSLKVKKLIF